MINKKNLWFLTLFSLILVLSVYYITMPSELLLSNSSNYITPKKEKTTTTIATESEVITAMKIAKEEEIDEQLDALKLVISDTKKTTDEKNIAFEKMKDINKNKTKEEEIEKLIEENYKYKSCVKIIEKQIKIVIEESKHDKTLANNIMRKVQENFEETMYITVEFKG